MIERRPRLAIVGASARAAAFSAIRGGFDVVAADMFADADLAAICNATRIANYPEGLADWLADTECSAWMYTGALENRPQLIDKLAAIRPLIGNRGDALRRARDPLILQDACSASQIPFPETRSSANGLPRDGTWLCKTYAGASGSGVWLFDGDAALERAERERAVFQSCIPGVPASAIFLLNEEGAELVGVTRQLIGDEDHPWRYNGSVGPIETANPCLETLARIGDLLHGEFKLRAFVGVDLILNGNAAWVIEINPRYTASMEILDRAAGHSMFATQLLAERSEERNLSQGCLAYGSVHAKRIIYALRDIQFSPSLSEWVLSQSSIELQRCYLADIPHAGERVAAGRPVLTAFATGKSEEDAMHELANRVGEVERRLYDE